MATITTASTPAPTLHKKDDWDKLAEHYPSMANSVTTKPTIAFLEIANKFLPFSSATAILDNGCGPGPVTSALLAGHGKEIPSTAKLHASDFSPAMLKQFVKVKDEKVAAGQTEWSRFETSIQDAQLLDGFEDNSLSHVIAGMLYMLVPDPQKALKATHRVLKPGGVIAFSSWHDSEWIQLQEIPYPGMKNTMESLLSSNYRSTEGLEAELKEAGFKDVEAHYVPTTMDFEDHRKFVVFLIEKIPHMIEATKDFTPEQRQGFEDKLVAEFKKMHPEAPGTMWGTAVIAVARK